MIGSNFPGMPLADRGSGTPEGGIEIPRGAWKWLAVCTLAVALAVWWVHRTVLSQPFDWRLVGTSVARARPGWLLLSVLAIYGAYLGRAVRWAVFLRPIKPKPSLWNVLSATIIGFTAITLLGRPGEFVRPYLIAAKEKVPVSSQVAAWFLERLLDLLVSLVIFGFALARVHASGIIVGPRLAGVLAVGGKVVAISSGVLLVLLISLRHFAEPAKRCIIAALRFLPERPFRRLEGFVTTFVQGVESMRSDAALLWLLLYSILEWIMIWGCYRSVAGAFTGFTLTTEDVWIFMGFVNLGAMVQIPGIGGGLQVASVLVLTELFGKRLELATGFALLLWITTVLAVLPLGLIVSLKEGLDWHKLSRMGREAST